MAPGGGFESDYGVREFYKPGDFLHHQDANQIRENESAIFGTDRTIPFIPRVVIKTPVAMPPFSVVRLGDTSTPFERPPIMYAKDPLTEATGPCYTNGGLRSTDEQRAVYEPIGLFPVQLRVDGDITADDRANVTDDGRAKKGAGPLYCCSVKEGDYAFFVQMPETMPNLTIQAPAGGIPEANNYQFGSVDCAVLQCDGDTWKDSGVTEKIYNPANEVKCSEGLRLGWAQWDGAKYVLISALCNDDRTFVAAELLTPENPVGP